MYFGHIAGITFLPVSIILFLNYFGYTHINLIFGININWLAAIGIVIVEAGDIVDAHIKGGFVILMWSICVILCLPAILFFISKIMTISNVILTALPLIMASFLFVEGLSSFYIGD